MKYPFLVLVVLVFLMTAACTGAVGPQGDTGPRGEAGPQGETGPQGATGRQGEAGSRGEAGPRGDTGPQGATGASAAGFSDLTDERATVVYVEAGSSLGSGVIVSETEIITAEHVIRGHDSATISVPGVGLVFATLVGWDRTRDVALLRFSSGGFTPRIARLPAGEVLSGGVTIYRDETPGLFDSVMALGFVPTISKTTPIATFGGIGVAWNIVPGDVGQYQFDAAITNGMSGGALFDANGTLAGMILSAGSFEGNNRALSWREILEALPELRAGVENP